MAEEPEKGRPVQTGSPGYALDRTNHLRIQKDAAQRLIARYLRETMNPADSNALANRIVDGIVSATPMPTRPAIRGWRMIDTHPLARHGTVRVRQQRRHALYPLVHLPIRTGHAHPRMDPRSGVPSLGSRE